MKIFGKKEPPAKGGGTPEQFRAHAKARLNQFIEDSARRIIDLLSSAGEAGGWIRPWAADPAAGRFNGLPFNPATGHRFSGGNLLSLWLTSQVYGFSDPRWVTYEQARGLGEDAHVRKGEKGTIVLRPHRVVVNVDGEELDSGSAGDVEDRIFNPGASTTEPRPGQEKKTKELLFFRPYAVFNFQQLEGLPESAPPPTFDVGVSSLVTRLVAATGVPVSYGGGRAFYSPAKDSIGMPYRHLFPDRASHDGVLAHEWGHSTGHSSRENVPGGPFGSPEYAMEELRAELISYMIGSYFGFPFQVENQAAYLKSWNDRIGSDPKSIFEAAAKAARVFEAVVDFAMGQQPKLEWFPPKEAWPEFEVESVEDAAALHESVDVPATPEEPIPVEEPERDWRVEIQSCLRESGSWLELSEASGRMVLCTSRHGIPEFGMPGTEDITEAKRLLRVLAADVSGLSCELRTEGDKVFLSLSPTTVGTPSPDDGEGACLGV